ncbi:hypothetical protein GCU60_13820 [Blastococcus saxobsidens]|uniref:Uncharacterized protein n=1 Tax=Blastococcus saxobsidens TaxID=138336 RepID=A0A6L9W5U3_9ACTN|nr:hypothetical protein [Blastococcus saxobsidens]NEK86820.1 hypothetical protein [Blastococcus saxobsidens]
MIWPALVLLSLGVVDLARWDSERLGRGSLLGPLLAGLLAAVVLRLGGLGTGATAGAVVVVVLLSLGWAVAVAASVREERPTWPALLVAGCLLGAALVLAPAAPPLGGRLERWYRSLPWPALDGVPLERALLVVACAVFLIGTGNVLVRLVLTASGSKVRRSEQQIKGGRVLGPMERLLILGLGLSGNVAAASIIVAAKGLLRFPELQSYRAEPGVDGRPADVATSDGARSDGARSDIARSDIAMSDIARSDIAMSDIAMSDIAMSDIATSDIATSDDEPATPGQRIDVLTEYFLIGSMTSWLLALACLALV